MHAGFNQYSPMPGVLRLRQRLSEKLERTYQVSYDPDTEITITAGGTQAIFCAIAAFISPGDEAIILEPAYDSYAPAIEINGGIVRPHRLRAPDYQVNWDEVGKLISSRTRIIIINTPHNPSGKVLLSLSSATKYMNT
jgi:methionine aminotransferase